MLGGGFTLEFRKLISDKRHSGKRNSDSEKNSNKDLRVIRVNVVVIG